MSVGYLDPLDTAVLSFFLLAYAHSKLGAGIDKKK